MNSKYKMIFPILFFLFIVPFVSLSVRAYNPDPQIIIIPYNPNGHTSLDPNTYLYHTGDPSLRLTAYPNTGYHFGGWYVNGTLFTTISNPMVWDFVAGKGNFTEVLDPYFTPNQVFCFNVTMPSHSYVSVNGRVIGRLYEFVQGGTKMNLEYYSANSSITFKSFVINGTITISQPSYSFYINGNTTLTINDVVRVPVSPQSSSNVGLQVFPSLVITGVLGGVFMGTGNRMGGHNIAGLVVGLAFGIIACTVGGLMPVWITGIIFGCGLVAFYFYFHKGSDE